MSTSALRGRRGALAAAATGASVIGLLALPGTASANGGVSQSVDLVLGVPAAVSSLGSLPTQLCFDPDGAGPTAPSCQSIPTATLSDDDLVLDLDYVLSSSTQPSAALAKVGEGVCGAAGKFGIVLELGPATYQPNSSIVFTLYQGTKKLAGETYPTGNKSTQYAPSFRAC